MPTPSHRPRKVVGDYILGKTIGAGSMGKVKIAVHRHTGRKVACKIIPRSPPGPDGIRPPDADNKEVRVVREAAILQLLHHPNIVRLWDFVAQPRHFFLFFEYVSGGQLLDYIIAHGRLPESVARKFLRQMASAVEYCHEHSVVHRDLKIENVLLTPEGKVKLIDFGLSNLYSPRSHLRTFCGSLYFAAPELLCARPYTGPEVDVWSLGVVLYVLVCGRVPFDDQSMPVLHAKIKQGHVEYPGWLTGDCKHLLSRMLVTHPPDRATLAEIAAHPWMARGVDGSGLNSHIPQRAPLSLPLDEAVLERMREFHFGREDMDGPDRLGGWDWIRDRLNSLVNSWESRRHTTNPDSQDHWTGQEAVTGNVMDEERDPLVSIYYLVREKMEREANGTEHDVWKEEDEDDGADEAGDEEEESLGQGVPMEERGRSERKGNAHAHPSARENRVEVELEDSGKAFVSLEDPSSHLETPDSHPTPSSSQKDDRSSGRVVMLEGEENEGRGRRQEGEEEEKEEERIRKELKRAQMWEKRRSRWAKGIDRDSPPHSSHHPSSSQPIPLPLSRWIHGGSDRTRKATWDTDEEDELEVKGLGSPRQRRPSVMRRISKVVRRRGKGSTEATVESESEAFRPRRWSMLSAGGKRSSTGPGHMTEDEEDDEEDEEERNGPPGSAHPSKSHGRKRGSSRAGRFFPSSMPLKRSSLPRTSQSGTGTPTGRGSWGHRLVGWLGVKGGRSGDGPDSEEDETNVMVITNPNDLETDSPSSKPGSTHRAPTGAIAGGPAGEEAESNGTTPTMVMMGDLTADITGDVTSGTYDTGSGEEEEEEEEEDVPVGEHDQVSRSRRRRRRGGGGNKDKLGVVYLRGLFSVATTSSKSPEELRDLVKQVEEREDLGLVQIGEWTWEGRIHGSHPTNGHAITPEEVDSVVALEEDGGEVWWEVRIVRVAWMPAMCGVRFRRRGGDAWRYKQACDRLVKAMDL